MLPSAIYEPLPFVYLGGGLLLLGFSGHPALLLAGLSLYLAGSLIWFKRGAYRRLDKQRQPHQRDWPQWVYESRPFALILLGAQQLLLRHQHRFLLARQPV
ncbi:hypothetical protein ACEUCJ_02040 [Aeromonas rivipollensis]|uniref:hypothetical protein n=1 Tax=Aeromonas rivipollensis TaxID=948519 RepID=UPI0038CF6987